MACLETYSTLRIFSDHIAPTEITKVLGAEPTESFCKGDLQGNGKSGRRHKTNGWFYSTEGLISSPDTRRHIDQILCVLDGKLAGVQALRVRGCELDIFSYYVSDGQGGPSLWPAQMLKLGALGLEIGWDIYFDKNEVPMEPVSPPS